MPRSEDSEQRFRTAADQFPMPIWAADPWANLEWVNLPFSRYFGLEDNTLEASRWLALVHPDDQEPALARLVAAVRARGPLHDLSRFRRADGLWRWLETWAQARYDDDGRYEGHMGTSIDVTERIEGEQALHASLGAERRGRERVEFLARNATNLAASTTVETLVNVVLTDLHEVLGLQGASLNLLEDNGRLRIIVSPGLEPLTGRYQGLPIEAPYPGTEVVRTGQRIVLRSRQEIIERFPGLTAVLPTQPVHTIAAFPLRTANRETVGALVVGAPEPDGFDDDVLNVLGAVADHTGLALERAMLYEQVLASREQQLQISLRLQHSLLPDELVGHPSLAIDAIYMAASDLLDVGGDWYDTFAWPGERIGILVGDVVGHDLDAAVAMGRLRAAMAALAPLIEPSAGALLQALDHCARGPTGTDFVTAACVVIDVTTGETSYATAGHPPPLVVDPDGTARWLDKAVSPPAGSIMVDHRPEAYVTLTPGSAVVLYTDGLVERLGETLPQGLERLLRSAVANAADGSEPSQVTNRLIADLTHDPSPLDDVITVCSRWEPDRFRSRIPAEAGELASLRDQLQTWLAHREIVGPRSDDVLLALSEAVSNSIRHAYPGSAGPVSVDIIDRGPELMVTVTDEGTWQPPSPQPAAGGYGTRIMRRLATRFDRIMTADGTRVIMRLPTGKS